MMYTAFHAHLLLLLRGTVDPRCLAYGTRTTPKTMQNFNQGLLKVGQAHSPCADQKLTCLSQFRTRAVARWLPAGLQASSVWQSQKGNT